MSVKAKVFTWRKSGKYYTSHEVELKPEHATMQGYDLRYLIVNNDPGVKYLSPVSSGFGSDEFYHTIDVDYGDKQGFCTYLILPWDMRRLDC
jgi:hypothetical protein